MAKFFVVTASLHRIITIACPATSTAVQRQAFASTWSKSTADDNDSDDDDSEEEDYYDLEDGWEDERGEEEYPDEVSESGDEPLDTSWEDSNEYDFEDPEYLRLPPSFNNAATDDPVESDEQDVDEASSFSCPMCQKEHTTLCATPRGYVYCVRCIRAALKYTESCPVCDERATEDQLRKIYISQE
ncbi:hypothetical protein EDD85DRAFT_100948 [Armillaria nabsnona]|nr:hypothetical protein EDD85DRAFT_100948 [Armillaria nabsnona]